MSSKLRPLEAIFCFIAVFGAMMASYEIGKLGDNQDRSQLMVQYLAIGVAGLTAYLLFRTLVANTKAVEASTEGNRIALLAQRPWVVLDRLTIAQNGPSGRVGIGIHFKNCGGSTALRVRFRAAYSGYEDSPLLLPSIEGLPTGVMGPGQVMMNATSPDVTVSDLDQGRLRIHIRADYVWVGGVAQECEFSGIYRVSAVQSPEGRQLRWRLIEQGTAT